jgi:hypothetical protein
MSLRTFMRLRALQRSAVILKDVIGLYLANCYWESIFIGNRAANLRKWAESHFRTLLVAVKRSEPRTTPRSWIICFRFHTPIFFFSTVPLFSHGLTSKSMACYAF